ncbi:MAG: ATP-dependent helicase, partial [Planctomycetota bacterium]
MSDLFADVDATAPDALPALSDEQRAAVEHEGGPLIVLAGPGTGKTRVITARVAHLIRARGVEPDAVLALTFTNKAAGELRHRMGGLVGMRDASAIHAGTMHAFGMWILRRFGDTIGLPGSIEILDSAQERRIARELIRAHGLFRSSMGRGIEAAIERGLRVCSELVNLGIAPADAIARAETASNATGPDGGAARAELAMFAESARFASLMDEACLDRGTPRFDDLLRWPIRLLARSDLAREIVRARCRHVVVDEFQDLNATQIDLLAALAPPGAAGRREPDVCVVGDDDQSIYAFRGADERAFERFSDRWGGGAVPSVRLTTNYRSGKPVVDASNAIIESSVYRFAPDKRGVPAPGSPDRSSVELVRMAKDTDSPQVIAGLLRSRIDREQDLDLSRVAVIGRTNGELRQIGAALDSAGVPFVSSIDDASREDPGVRLLLNWCELLVDPTRSWAARAVLTHPPFRCDPAALGALEQRYRNERSRAQDADGAGDPGPFLVWAARHTAGRGGPGEAIARASELEHALGRSISGFPADQSLLRIVRATGVANAEDLDRRARAARVRSIVGLLRFARERIGRIGEPADLRAFLEYLEDLPDREKSFARPPAEAVEPGIEEGVEGDGVRLLTAHASKGLEFDTVYIARVCPGWGFPKTQGNDEPVVPEAITGSDPDGRSRRDRLLDEERR